MSIDVSRWEHWTLTLHERKRADDLAQRQIQAQRILQIAESRLRQAVRVGALYLWDVDPAGQRRYEAAVADLIGLQGGDLQPGVFAEAVIAADRQAEVEAFSQALREPGRVHSWSFRLRGADGAERVVISSGQAFFNDDGTLFEFVGVLRDITDLSRQRAEAEDRALFAEQMVGIVSHDLRNPLSAMIMGATALARTADLPPRTQKLLGSILGAGSRAKRLIADLLDFTAARVGEGLSVTPAPVNLHEVAAKCVEELQLVFPDRVLRLVEEGEGKCAVDADRIAQLLGNLVGNAASYGNPDRPITVTSSLTEGEARLSVHNEGAPISEHLLPTIFEAMVRGGNPGQSVRSVGLGLFIVRAIAVAHGGTVNVVSDSTEGTLFTFVLPLPVRD